MRSLSSASLRTGSGQTDENRNRRRPRGVRHQSVEHVARNVVRELRAPGHILQDGVCWSCVWCSKKCLLLGCEARQWITIPVFRHRVAASTHATLVAQVKQVETAVTSATALVNRLNEARGNPPQKGSRGRSQEPGKLPSTPVLADLQPDRGQALRTPERRS